MFTREKRNRESDQMSTDLELFASSSSSNQMQCQFESPVHKACSESHAVFVVGARRFSVWGLEFRVGEGEGPLITEGSPPSLTRTVLI